MSQRRKFYVLSRDELIAKWDKIRKIFNGVPLREWQGFKISHLPLCRTLMSKSSARIAMWALRNTYSYQSE